MNKSDASKEMGGAMKTMMRSGVVAGLLMLAAAQVMAFSGTYEPGAGINGTVHDLSSSNPSLVYPSSPPDPLDRVCIYCHAPHNTYRLNNAPGGAGPLAPAEFDYLPLWNHTLQANTAYSMYDNGPGAPQSGSQASQAILNGGMAPGSTSLLCLSCHDGSVAVNSYGNGDQLSSSQGNDFISAGYVIGKDKYLGNHHPIGFNYDVVQSGDTEINNADAALLTPTSFIRDHLYGDAKMECGTCHSVHNKGNSGETLLWRSDRNSELCLTCHNKGTYQPPTP